MNYKELLEYLEIENSSEFEFFEQFSALLECEEDIEFNYFFTLLNEVEGHLLSEMTDNYFEDLLSGIPDDAMHFYSLLQTIKHGLCDLAKEDEGSKERAVYIEELFNFRNWLIFDSRVKCLDKSTNILEVMPIFEALILFRSEKLGNDKMDYDFSECMEYRTDNFILEESDEDDDEDY